MFLTQKLARFRYIEILGSVSSILMSSKQMMDRIDSQKKKSFMMQSVSSVVGKTTSEKRN